MKDTRPLPGWYWGGMAGVPIGSTLEGSVPVSHEWRVAQAFAVFEPGEHGGWVYQVKVTEPVTEDPGYHGLFRTPLAEVVSIYKTGLRAGRLPGEVKS